MPASGRGANLDTSRRVGAPKPLPPPVRTPVRPTPNRSAPPVVNLRAPVSSTPFKPAQRQAAQRVQQAARKLPEQPHPHIPLLPAPTAAQSHAVMRLAEERQKQSGVPKAAYYEGLRNDPRSRPYVQALEHYARASQAHYEATLGRTQAGGGENASAQQSPAALRLARAEAVALGRQLVAGGRRETAAAATPAHRGFLEGSVVPLAASLIPGLGTTPGLKPIAEAGLKKGLALGDALSKDPAGATRQTLTSIPETLNGIFAGTGRLVGEATIEGKPGAAIQQLVKGISGDYSNRYGGLSKPGGIEKDAQRMVKEGYLPELLDATIAVGGPGTVAGKAISRGVEATGYGAEDFARLVARREAERQVAQAPHAASELPRALTRAQTRRATVYESATQPRPNLRVAPGDEQPSPVPGSAVQPQTRSSNFFRGRAQTAIDNARRQRTVKGLAQINAVRDQLERDPNALIAHPPKPASPLARDVRRGEVAPLIQRGGSGAHWPGAAFFGAGKQQRIGASALKGGSVERRTAEGKVLEGEFNKLLKQATPEQRAILVHAKEGMLPLHDPQAATQWLRELHAQAIAGSRPNGRSLIPIGDRLGGSDVARETGRVLKHIEKNGPESVFTPQFEKLVQRIPDERLTAARDSSLSQDALTSRRYRPQMQMLQRWAQDHPEDPLAHQTNAMVEQVKRLEREGGDLRKGRSEPDLAPATRHELAAQKYATAKNLADEAARLHGLPTDRAYVEHTRRFTHSNLIRTVGTSAPRVARQMEGDLMRQGYRSTDARLILNGMLKNIRNDYKIKYLLPFDKRFNAAPAGLTAHQAQEWLRASGRDPKDWQVVHLGKLRRSLAEDLNMEHAQHFNLDAEAHAAHTTNQLDAALGHNIPRSDTLKGAGVYPTAAVNELKGAMSSSALGGRVLGRLKASVSSLMLGTSLPWLTTMSTVTYPIQSLYSGAGPFSLREAVGWYRGFDQAGKRELDRWFGIDTPFEQSTHGITSERIGASAPKGKTFQELAHVTHAAGDFPFVRALRKMRPDHMVLRMERVPRRYARINVAYKGVKTEALRQLLKTSKDMAEQQHSFELGLARLQHFGRRPAAEYLDAALKNQQAMEKHAVFLEKAMGEWKRTTQFERNILGRMVLFYPWLRYSVKLATRTLPAEHPLAYALALQYGSIQHDYLRELLGTDPTVGTIYLGHEQPHTPPEKRQFKTIGIRQANPLMNTVGDLLGAESPAQVLDVLPPYLADFIEYAAGKNLFTDRPLKGAQPGETELKPGHRPNVLNFALNRALAVTNPGRTAMRVTAHGRPTSDEYLPGGDQFVRYSPETLNKIKREQKGQGETPGSQLLAELLPLVPHGDQGRLAAKLRDEKRTQGEARAKARKEHHASGRHAAASEAEQAQQDRLQLRSGGASSSSAEDEAALRDREALARR